MFMDAPAEQIYGGFRFVVGLFPQSSGIAPISKASTPTAARSRDDGQLMLSAAVSMGFLHVFFLRNLWGDP